MVAVAVGTISPLFHLREIKFPRRISSPRQPLPSVVVFTPQRAKLYSSGDALQGVIRLPGELTFSPYYARIKV
ncbi:hypothetical protein E2C01_076477 [Portunus trituberculatus]|uniref:Uncharacterized protein n=1 Tax=Portunus trituberculatus TaxID=210409 RepID=A0A5B7I8U2_PORTR|nr:hypothetical protein [Portunus trituberculatus]